MSQQSNARNLRLALPKGRMQEGVFSLLADAGIQIQSGSRSYRPSLNLQGFDTKLLKPQNIIEMLHQGSRDVGFAGADWVQELDSELVELLDTKLNPVRLIAAAPKEMLVDGKLPNRHLAVASEYQTLTRKWIEKKGLDASCVRSYGATEVFPPEDADLIVDNTATGSTLVANGLQIVDELMTSSTRMYANPKTMQDPSSRECIENLVLLVQSVLEARARVMVEVNIGTEQLEALVKVLPCMRNPTISRLFGDAGYAVKAAVMRKELPNLIPAIRACGGTDLVVTSPSQIMP